MEVRQLVLEKDQFVILLYYVDPGGQHRLRIAVPQEKLMAEIHSGPFGGHFAARSSYNTLAQHYWWGGMFGNVTRWCLSCLTYAAYQGCGRRTRTPLQPIPVGCHLNVLVSKCHGHWGNQYVGVFVEYLTKWVEAYAVDDHTSEMIARLLVDNVV